MWYRTSIVHGLVPLSVSPCVCVGPGPGPGNVGMLARVAVWVIVRKQQVAANAEAGLGGRVVCSCPRCLCCSCTAPALAPNLT